MLENYQQSLPDYAKDIKLNLSTVLRTGDTALSETQIQGVALASAYATKNKKLVETIKDYTKNLDAKTINAIKGAASLMAMNNVYYRFVHLSEDPEFSQMPANLRMNLMGNPGIPKLDFELYSLAVSAINGCGMCISSHTKSLLKEGLNKASIQHCIRIASVINALAQINKIEKYET
jgi:alkyl hydroperoxide reductase subunit D